MPDTRRQPRRVQALHRELLRRLRSKNADATAVLAMGPGARRLVPNVVPAGLDVIDLGRVREPDFQASWQEALTQLAGCAYPRDLANPTFTAPPPEVNCPGIDLPYGGRSRASARPPPPTHPWRAPRLQIGHNRERAPRPALQRVLVYQID